MKSYWFMLSSLILAGCVASNGLQYEAMSETNWYHLARVRKGMSEKEVLFIMHKPYSYETFQVDEDIYDVWFYVTRMTGLDQTRMVPQNLTPLTFKNGVLVGTGYPWYYYAMKEQAREINDLNPPPPRPKTQAEEDAEFERTLRSHTPPQSSQPPTQPMQPPAAPQSASMPAQTAAPQSQPPAAPQPAAQQQVPAPPKAQSPPVLHAQGPALCQDRRLSRVARGMTETQVFSVMGEPINHSTYEMGGDVYDIWFYETVPSKTGRITTLPQNITPLTFKNAFLVGITEEEFFDVKAKVDCLNTPQPASASEMTTVSESLGMIQKNQLSKVGMGMTEAEVTNLLGVPARNETFQIHQDVYDVWFYDSAPLTFKNGVLAGMTMDYYSSVKQKSEEDHVDCYDRDAERMQQEENDQNFNYW